MDRGIVKALTLPGHPYNRFSLTPGGQRTGEWFLGSTGTLVGKTTRGGQEGETSPEATTPEFSVWPSVGNKNQTIIFYPIPVHSVTTTV